MAPDDLNEKAPYSGTRALVTGDNDNPDSLGTMAVMAMSLKNPDGKSKETKTKSLEKYRPITATLEHPLILDIKLLQKLDMTTFTKKGLMALSKFSGISLITKNNSKRKLTKCIKSIQGSKRQVSGERDDGRSSGGVVKSGDSVRSKRKSNKVKISRFKHQVNFKLVGVDDAEIRVDDDGRGTQVTQDEDEEEDDSSDVVCKRHDKLTDRTVPSQGHRRRQGVTTTTTTQGETTRKAVADSRIETIPEPCKSCSRSRQPERLHSHPRVPAGVMDTERRKAGEWLHGPITADGVSLKKSLEKNNGRGKLQCAKSLESTQKGLLSISPSDDSNSGGSPKARLTVKTGAHAGSPIKGNSPAKDPSKTMERKSSLDVRGGKKLPISSPEKSPKCEKSKSDGVKKGESSPSSDGDKSGSRATGDDALKYMTECYVCGRQVALKARMTHEKECILEWRNQNRLLAPEDRKPEPVRPDYRFTASGDVDYQGTFESIWANHQDSLVPCKKCGRTFFPDRIERHENCCNTLPARMKFKY